MKLCRSGVFALCGLALSCTVEVPDPIVEVPDDGKLGAGPDEAVDPAAPGPFAVGVTTFTVDDPTRPDPITGVAPRRLIVEVWYPAEDDSLTLPREDYGLEHLLSPEQLALFNVDPEQEARIPSISARDVPLRLDQGPYPLVIFSHGNGGVRVQSIFLTEHLASHGYVVASLDHAGNTLSDTLASGSVLGDPEALLQVAQDRPKDVTVVIDAVLARNTAPGDLLSGSMDESEIGITGHSFGAYTSLASSGLDPRIVASAPLAPPSSLLLTLAANINAGDIPVNTLILAGGIDVTLPFEENQQEVFDNLPNGKRLLVNILTAGHFTFSDICALDLVRLGEVADVDIEGLLEDGCGPQNIEPAAGHEITNSFVTAFFNAELRDSFPSRALLRELLNDADPAEVATQTDLIFPLAP